MYSTCNITVNLMISVCVLYGTIRYGTVRKLWLDLTLYVLYLDVGIVSLAFDSADIEILRFDLSSKVVLIKSSTLTTRHNKFYSS